MLEIEEIKRVVAENKRFLVKYKIELMVIFGSYGTEEFKAGESDIDLAFLTSIPLSENCILNLVNEFSSIIKYSNIDFIDLNRASGLLKYEIASKGRLVYEKKRGLFERYSLYCYRYYYDTHKFRVLRQEYFENKLKELGEL